MKDKQQSHFVNIGSSSLLVIFLVLCLATFAILSLSSARSNYSFSERLAEHRQAYYAASASAETIVDEIDTIICGIAEEVDLVGQKKPDFLSAYLDDVRAVLEGKELEGVLLQYDRTETGDTVSFRVPAGEQQELLVVLEIMDYTDDVNYYAVRAWKLVNIVSWEEEEPLRLLQ